MSLAIPASISSRSTLSAPALGVLALAQMLPATALTPAIRPLFAELHAGHDGALHAFFALHMVGGALAAPTVVAAVRRGCPPRSLFLVLGLLDALLVASFALPVSTALVLAARLVEGAAHVGTCTLLLALAASPTRARSAVPAVGLGIMGAVAAGSVVGAVLVAAHPRAPIAVGATLLAAVALTGWLSLHEGALCVREPAPKRPDAELAGIAASAFAARFLVGCLVVSFALLAHRAHGLSDASIARHFALVTVPFALATFPLARLAERASARALSVWLVGGMLVMGASCAALGYLRVAALGPAMILIGLGSAAVFSALLGRGATAPDELARARRMGIINAAGCVGMLLGPTLAGVAAALGRTPHAPHRGQVWALLLGGVVPVVWALCLAGRAALGGLVAGREARRGAS